MNHTRTTTTAAALALCCITLTGCASGTPTSNTAHTATPSASSAAPEATHDEATAPPQRSSTPKQPKQLHIVPASKRTTAQKTGEAFAAALYTVDTRTPVKDRQWSDPAQRAAIYTSGSLRAGIAERTRPYQDSFWAGMTAHNAWTSVETGPGDDAPPPASTRQTVTVTVTATAHAGKWTKKNAYDAQLGVVCQRAGHHWTVVSYDLIDGQSGF